ncbi:anti-sigma regulatory factor [Thermoanaerobacterium thermosaccharolyticum]|uniref:Anti-sigma regulatory factor n=3 Tax=Thermoanaerobacterium thermosaccharolyticum TaxID=1517 RepID=A0A231VMG9_THETR|nr:ATP-binding protein [Thermoanaerobacterium thermosaccharolyticum]TCW41942.1 anti-sigma regulatory factor (Ser/Thr protein kinase) [Thermohydrogenium kirishiense]ADL68632.1 putative anti-sigma regulatory factor, serine/threonine protein kinase [Thermoanaerobacterium thermosaccharolyticum DSM 571]AST56396.1 anti-sigma regulatory factor, serine/threonine protein kinase [Thermoanaerobacterium thermosaccharolyticum]KAA5806775.1 anti-sigma regulatory factor [Thermoanaerobacterium thermosaccharolyt
MKPYIMDFDVKARDFSSAGESSSTFRKTLLMLSVPSDIVRRASIAAYEAEMNIVIHSYGGKMHFEIYSDKIVIIAEDTGPGIKDLELAMTEGYSTAPKEVIEMGFGAGMGLPNMKRNADVMDIVNHDENGTKIVMTINI